MRLAKAVAALTAFASMVAGSVAAAEGQAGAAPPPHPNFQLVESWPIETTLDHQEIPDAAEVWVSLIEAAQKSLDMAQFYASSRPNGGGRLEAVIAAIEKAAGRGVKVRFLSEEKFYKIYPEVLDRLAKVENITVRRLDSAAFDGGVLHAKYFIVDDRLSYIGSQNFDWRALEHIQELGLAVGNPELTWELRELFELDWSLAELSPPREGAAGAATSMADSLVKSRLKPRGVARYGHVSASGDTLRYQLVASPAGRLSNPGAWDEPLILNLLDGARESIEIQLLTYRKSSREGGDYEALDEALRRAAGRGVAVKLLVSDWCKRKPAIDDLKSLSLVPGIEVRLMSIPQWSGGFIPFARVCHAKYLLVDEHRFWVGTSNWEKDYFYKSRNVGVLGTSRVVGKDLGRFFDTAWGSAYAERLKANVEYVPPRISE
jgi:phosphatidylserine/phosphatidylglycerophosphate/cardiolipin synthase-like enzyme